MSVLERAVIDDRARVARIGTRFGHVIQDDWRGIAPVWPLLEQMRAEGAVVLVKLDGERRPPRDNGQYTVVASGGPIGAHPIRTDAGSIEAALTHLIVEYDRRVWRG